MIQHHFSHFSLCRVENRGAPKKEATDAFSNETYETYDYGEKMSGEFILVPEKDKNKKPKIKDGKPVMNEVHEFRGDKILKNFLNPLPVDWAVPPSPLGAKREVLSFSCGKLHLLVVARDAGTFETRVYSAGNGAEGQLGHGNNKEYHALTPITRLDNKRICKVAAGQYHSLALGMNGVNIYSWGQATCGQLGLFANRKECEDTKQVRVPTEVPFPTVGEFETLGDIACGDSTCFAVTLEGSVYSWGMNDNGQTGHSYDGENDIYQPRKVDIMNSVSLDNPGPKNCRVIRVDGGGQHTLMVVKRLK
jgi:alpha-tubulin suppressor-like RCC1 family protein